ncbi:MAG: hypothetical protein DA408_15235 [Bacteroidetes bacterium]|nr:MAG: hypothetical protein C7N36_04585 [Bacteroidota bacterium]PTM10747.1 MAG: hypothetical protein DA408_15235 [Bacteroidota bacterium]
MILISAALLALLMTACGGKPVEVSLRLTPKERGQIDTLYTAQLDSLRPLWDSLCEARYETDLRRAIDSIVTQRTEEEIRLRSRLHK